MKKADYMKIRTMKERKEHINESRSFIIFIVFLGLMIFLIEKC